MVKIPHPLEDSDNQIPSSPGRAKVSSVRGMPKGGNIEASI